MRISEFAERANVTAVTVRYYEKMGLLHKIERKNGVRVFGERDLEWIKFIICLKKAGLSVESLARYTMLHSQGDTTLQERQQILIKERDKVRERKKEIDTTLAKLDSKVDNYDTLISRYESTLR